MRGLSLDQLRAFSAVAECGSVSAAAARLSLTQPAVSIQIRQLERRLGLRLFERVGRRVAPTAAADRLLPHIRSIDQAVNATLAAAADCLEDVAGRVRIGTGATACIYLLPPVLRELRRRFPRIDIVVRTGNSPDILRELQDNMVDVAVATLPAAGDAFVVEPLVEDEIVAVLPAALAEDVPAIAAGPATAALLATLPMLLYEPGGNARRVIDGWFRRAGVALTPIMELGSIEAIKQLIAAGLGCGLLPRLAVADGRAMSETVVRSLAPPLSRQLGLVMRRDKIPDRALREVVTALRRLAAR